MAQGEAWNKDEVIELLKPYLELSYTVNRACSLAHFPQSTVATWMADDELLRLKVEGMQNAINLQARKNIAKNINDGKIDDSKWWIEKTDKDFSQKTETELSGGLTVKIVEDGVHNE